MLQGYKSYMSRIGQCRGIDILGKGENRAQGLWWHFRLKIDKNLVMRPQNARTVRFFFRTKIRDTS